MKEVLRVGQVRCYAPPGRRTNDLRVIQEINSDGVVYGGNVLELSGQGYYVEYLTSGTWIARMIGDLIMTWSEEELERAVVLGLRIRGK